LQLQLIAIVQLQCTIAGHRTIAITIPGHRTIAITIAGHRAIAVLTYGALMHDAWTKMEVHNIGIFACFMREEKWIENKQHMSKLVPSPHSDLISVAPMASAMENGTVQYIAIAINCNSAIAMYNCWASNNCNYNCWESNNCNYNCAIAMVAQLIAPYACFQLTGLPHGHLTDPQPAPPIQRFSDRELSPRITRDTIANNRAAGGAWFSVELLVVGPTTGRIRAARGDNRRYSAPQNTLRAEWITL
jgi:hypothetical protein